MAIKLAIIIKPLLMTSWVLIVEALDFGRSCDHGSSIASANRQMNRPAVRPLRKTPSVPKFQYSPQRNWAICAEEDGESVANDAPIRKRRAQLLR
jgi:hypothetical protein